MNPITAGKEALEAIVLPLREEKQRLSDRIDQIDLTLKPLEAAISPLDGKPRSKKKTKPTRTVTQNDVRLVLQEIVTSHPTISKEKLLTTAKQKLKVEQGLDLKGFSNRCREVLQELPFDFDPAGQVRLAAASTTSGEPSEAILLPHDPQSTVDNSVLAKGER